MSTVAELKEDINRILEESIEGLSVEIIDCIIHQRSKLKVIEVLADRPKGGITLDECTAINRNFSQKLEDEDLIQGEYVVEVSSPGLDRPLVTQKDFLRNIGKNVRFHLKEKIENKKEYSGTIEDVKNEEVIIQTKSTCIAIPIVKIVKAIQII